MIEPPVPVRVWAGYVYLRAQGFGWKAAARRVILPRSLAWDFEHGRPDVSARAFMAQEQPR